MISSENMELTDLIEREFTRMGGRATVADLQAHLSRKVRPELQRYVYLEGLTSKIKAYLRQKGNDGLAKAPAVDARGTHVQLELLSIEEFEFVVNSLQASSAASISKARLYSDKCYDVHGVRISVEPVAGVA